MSENINLYKSFSGKKFEEIINKIEDLEKIKTPQYFIFLAFVNYQKNVNNEDRLSAREDFRQAFEKDKYSNIGIEAY